jgi:hypothetical protein
MRHVERQLAATLCTSFATSGVSRLISSCWRARGGSFCWKRRRPRRFYPEAARNMLSLAGSIGRRTTECIVVHAASKSAPSGKALIEGAQAMAIGPMLKTLRGGHRP